MSQQDVEAIRAGFEAFARGDWETALANVAPDFELVDHVIIEGAPAGRGPEIIQENIGQLLEAFRELNYEILETVDLDDRVLIRLQVTARASYDSGLEIDSEVGQLWTIRDGVASRLEIFPSWAEAREAAGLER